MHLGKLLSGSTITNTVAIAGLLWVIWTFVLQNLTKKVRLKRDLELASVMSDLGLEVSEDFLDDLNQRSKEILESTPWVIGVPHVLTLSLGVLAIASAVASDSSWWVRGFNGAFGIVMLGIGVCDLLWCYWREFRYSPLGQFFDRKFSLIGEGTSGKRRRYFAVLERDQKLGKLPPGASINYPGKPPMVDTHTETQQGSD